MDDSDDYPDDFIFDEQTLAILDQEEQKYLTQSTSLDPVTKKLKTSAGWKPGIGARTISHDNLDDLPEISLHGDGTYGVEPTGAKRSTVGTPLAPTHLHEANSAVYQPAGAPASRFPSVHLSQNQRQLSSHQHTKPISTIASSAKRKTSSPSGIMSPAHPLEGQMLEYQKKLDELREENTRIQTALKEALDARIAKEGEVSILRKSIEKTSQNHSAQIAKLKVAKDEADAKRVQLQKELKEEMESLKTQYIFKQHELEASLRKPPMSSRAKKVLREPPSTPLAIPVQMRNWNSNHYEQGPSKSFSQETPLKPQRLPPLRESPSRSRLSPSKTKKAGMLPGFQNSFVASTPLRPMKSRANKEKAKAEDDDSFFHDLRSPSRSQRNAQRFSSPPPLHQQNDFDRMLDTDTVVQPPAGHTVPTSLRVLDDDGDAVMAEDSEGELTLEELNFLGPTNWKAEVQLCQIILTHARPKLGEITFQLLLGVSLAVVETDRLAEDYAIACSEVFQTVANTSSDSNYNLSLDAICKSLFMIATILSTADQLLPLASLLNLLSVLVYSLPGFTISLFSHQEKPEDQGSSFINFLCTLIVKKLAPSATHVHKDDLADELLLLLQSLCHNTPDELVPSLTAIPSHQQAMMILLDSKQPSWLLAKACKLLALLSTHHVLFRPLLSIPGSGTVDERMEDEEQKNIYVERLCLHLIDFDRQDADSRDFKKSILQFFAQLSISHLDAYTALVESYSLMPSLVLYLTELTTPLWEDAKHLMSSQETTASIIRTTNQTLFLIHHLVFSTDPAPNLRYQLQRATNRVFNNIIHMFIVTLGRLSYADPPEWVDSQGRYELETLSEMSRDILELVVDGPEGDSIWAAFQVEPEPGSAVDDEELEARRIMDGDG